MVETRKQGFVLAAVVGAGILIAVLWPGDTAEMPPVTSDSPIAIPIAPKEAAKPIQKPAARHTEQKQTPQLSVGMKRAINRLMNDSSQGMQPEQRADGSKRVELQGRFRHVPVATLNQDGSIQIQEFSRPIPVH